MHQKRAAPFDGTIEGLDERLRAQHREHISYTNLCQRMYVIIEREGAPPTSQAMSRIPRAKSLLSASLESNSRWRDALAMRAQSESRLKEACAHVAEEGVNETGVEQLRDGVSLVRHEAKELLRGIKAAMMQRDTTTLKRSAIVVPEVHAQQLGDRNCPARR